MREYFDESEDFYNVACKWNTGKSENPCTNNNQYPIDVLNNMVSLLKKNKVAISHHNNIFIKKLAFNFILKLNKISYFNDLKNDFKKADKYDKISEKLFKFI